MLNVYRINSGSKTLLLLTMITMCGAFVATTNSRISITPWAKDLPKPTSVISTAFVLPEPGRFSYTTNTMIKMKLWPGIGDKVENGNDVDSREKISIGKNIGSGSYGTVHLATLISDENSGVDGGEGQILIAKRAWTIDELRVRLSTTDGSSSSGSGEEAKESPAPLDESTLQKKAKRCQYYLDVEKHCFTKIAELQNSQTGVVPDFLGTYTDQHDHHEWIVFKMVSRRPIPSKEGMQQPIEPAKTLAQAIDLDWIDQHSSTSDESGSAPHHHLYIVQEEMGLPHTTDFAGTLDAVFTSLLQTISSVHSFNIVHRDVKPHNLLFNAHTQSLVIIDFGSAADMDPSSSSSLLPFAKNRRIGYNDNGNTVAVSPIYAAPETFIDADRAPTNFDTFSSALVFCQLMFNLLDERSDAGFRQQLQEAKYDLDSWLSRELASTIRFAGLDDALSYVAERPGLWSLLKDMLHPNPEIRISSREAQKRFQDILSLAQESEGGRRLSDGPYFESVLESFEICSIPMIDDGVAVGVVVMDPQEEKKTTATTIPPKFLAQPRPLHFVATFERQYPLGLVLSEVNSGDEDDEEEVDQETETLWKEATQHAQAGEVFIRDIVQNGQAYKMDIFEVGDRLRAVGEIPLLEGGFGYALELVCVVILRLKSMPADINMRFVSSNIQFILNPSECMFPPLLPC
uniref:Protein kinase domain-containing protein n=1 Tax=Ditylum brightwellii TaxID=49249 RepID=A0A7S4T6Z0_9STRA|mmetsp:Transcript_7379/g.9788  ORF Transcript_7379/g.9788 Transcript_7379/m.9788 type:complete len:686 (-) Transcript_7379:386-2443(-)